MISLEIAFLHSCGEGGAQAQPTADAVRWRVAPLYISRRADFNPPRFPCSCGKYSGKARFCVD